LISATASQMKCGIGDYTMVLADALANQGSEVYVATSTLRPVQPDGPQYNPIHWVNVDRWNMESLRRIAQGFVADPPDIIHLQYPAKPFRHSIGIVFAPFIFRATLKRPFIITLHVFRKMVFYKKPPFLGLIWGSDHVIVTAPREKLTLSKLGFGRRTTVIPIGVNFPPSFCAVDYVDKRDLIRSQFGIGPQDFVLCNFGLIEPNKKLERIIEAAARLRQEMPVHLLFIGPFEPESSPYHRYLKSLAARYHIDPYVHWAGYRDSSEIQPLLASADVAVLLYPDGVSWQRTAVLAALECGLPVIANEGDGIPNELAHGHNIFLVSEPRSDLLCQAIRTLGSDARFRQKLGIAGRQTMLARPTWKQIVSDHLQVYQTLMRDRVG
jgi:glycosyltransferase involved in cell wall biosynthesis